MLVANRQEVVDVGGSVISAPPGDVVDVAGGERHRAVGVGAGAVHRLECSALWRGWRCVGCGRHRGPRRHRSTRSAGSRRHNTCRRTVSTGNGMPSSVSQTLWACQPGDQGVVVDEHTDLRHPLRTGPTRGRRDHRVDLQLCPRGPGVAVHLTQPADLRVDRCVQGGVTHRVEFEMRVMHAGRLVDPPFHARPRPLRSQFVDVATGSGGDEVAGQVPALPLERIHTQTWQPPPAAGPRGRRTRPAVRRRGGGWRWRAHRHARPTPHPFASASSNPCVASHTRSRSVTVAASLPERRPAVPSNDSGGGAVPAAANSRLRRVHRTSNASNQPA